jgi:hypothetical protein
VTSDRSAEGRSIRVASVFLPFGHAAIELADLRTRYGDRTALDGSAPLGR